MIEQIMKVVSMQVHHTIILLFFFLSLFSVFLIRI